MAKGEKKSKKTSGGAKGGKNKAPKEPVVEKPPEEEPQIVEEPVFREITVTIEGYRNIEKSFLVANLFAKCRFSENELGETEKILLTDDVDITCSNQQFRFSCNIKSIKELDSLISNPILFTVYQERDETCPPEEPPLEGPITLNIDSAISLYEGLIGGSVEKGKVKLPKKGKKDKKGKKASKKGSKTSKKSSKSSKTSQKSKGSSKKSAKPVPLRNEPVVIGHCTLDLLPLVLSNQSRFEEYLVLTPPQTFLDDKMVTHKNKPGMLVSVSVGPEEVLLDDHCQRYLLSVTVESIFNLPSAMNEELQYQVCVKVPAFNSAKVPMVIENGQIKTTQIKKEYRFWPHLPRDYYNVSKYKIEADTSSVKNTFENKDVLKNALEKDSPRIQFNNLNRNLLLRDGFLNLNDHIHKYGRVIFEVFGSQKEGQKLTKFIHLMAVLDLSSLLYPGATKVRVATQLRTYQCKEALQLGGLEDSFFMPAPKIVPAAPSAAGSPKEKGKKGKKGGKDKKSKSSKSSKSKSSKGSKGSKGSKKGKKKGGGAGDTPAVNLKDALPAEPIPPPPLPPSTPVFSEQGEPTFIVIEVEITQALTEKKPIEDLQKELVQLLHSSETAELSSKINFNVLLEDKYTSHMIKKLIAGVNEEFATYTKVKESCACEIEPDFLAYLRRTGIYQSLVYAMRQVALTQAEKRMNLIGPSPDRNEFQRVVEELFTLLVVEVNKVLNTLINPVAVVAKESDLKQENKRVQLHYANEAREMGYFQQSERYYLQRLQHNFNDADCWFDYAVQKMQNNEEQKAILCLHEGLSRNIFHRNCLLMNGLLLANEKKEKEAELCLLTLMVQEPRWCEGWTALFLFYESVEDCAGGMEMCQEMALKYLDDARSPSDYFSTTDNLVWCSKICPNTIYFRVAVLLLKMRLYSWVEQALKHEMDETGVVHYLLAVISYYRRDYVHAAEHLERAKIYHGSDHAVVSLSGHCCMKLGKIAEARKEYLYILESFQKPEYNHLMHLNYALITEDVQERRKTYLLACKNKASPYTWLQCGICYLKQRDLLSAEECFSEAIYLDNSIAESWAFLTIINLQLFRIWDAELCYNIALKNNLQNQDLLHDISIGFEKLRKNLK